MIARYFCFIVFGWILVVGLNAQSLKTCQHTNIAPDSEPYSRTEELKMQILDKAGEIKSLFTIKDSLEIVLYIDDSPGYGHNKTFLWILRLGKDSLEYVFRRIDPAAPVDEVELHSIPELSEEYADIAESILNLPEGEFYLSGNDLLTRKSKRREVLSYYNMLFKVSECKMDRFLIFSENCRDYPVTIGYGPGLKKIVQKIALYLN